MFDQSTRRYVLPQPAQAKPTGGGSISWNLPPSGILARIWLQITGSVAGSLSAPNALGMASVVRRVRLTANSGQDLINMSGGGYHYLARDFNNLGRNPVPTTNARSAVTATTFDVSMLLEQQINQRDPLGMIMLQNRQTVLTLSIDFEADATVATGATVTATATPYLEVFSVPQKPEDYPPFNMIYQFLEDTQSVTGAQDYIYTWQRGGTYIGIHHGAGIGASPTDSWTRYRMRTNQSNYIYDVNPLFFNHEFATNHAGGLTRNVGHIPVDLAGSSGLEMFGKARDFINSIQLTNLESVITTTGALTLYTVRRQLIPLG